MINQINIALQFPLGAHFSHVPEIDAWKAVFRFIHELSCFQTDQKCSQCSQNLNCRYFLISGQNFEGYPCLTAKIDLFSERFIKPEDILHLTFYAVGDLNVCVQFVQLFFESSNRLCGHEFLCKNVEVIPIDAEPIAVRNLQIQTPIETNDVISVYNEMVLWYNHHYGCSFPFSFGHCQFQTLKMSSEKIKTGTKTLIMDGVVGTFQFDPPVMLDQTLLKVGIGKWNGIGGGHCAVKN